MQCPYLCLSSIKKTSYSYLKVCYKPESHQQRGVKEEDRNQDVHRGMDAEIPKINEKLAGESSAQRRKNNIFLDLLRFPEPFNLQ